MATESSNRNRIRALLWLLDGLLAAGDDLRALVVRPGALTLWRRQQLAVVCRDLGEALEPDSGGVEPWGNPRRRRDGGCHTAQGLRE